MTTWSRLIASNNSTFRISSSPGGLSGCQHQAAYPGPWLYAEGGAISEDQNASKWGHFRGSNLGDPLYEQWIEKEVEHARTAMTAPGRRLNERKQWKHIIEVVEHVFGADLDAQLIASVFKMHSGELNLFVDAYLEYRSHSVGSLVSPPKNEPDHLRPRVLKYRSYSRNRSARVYNSWTDPERDPFDFMDRLRYLLLYCHGVAIDNPLVELADESREWSPDEPAAMPRWTLAQRLNFQAYLTFIYTSAPLIEKGILVLLEPRGDYAPIHGNSEVALATRQSDASFVTVKEYWATPAGLTSLKKVAGANMSNSQRDVLAEALLDIFDDLSLMNASQGRLDLYLPDHKYERLFRLVSHKAISAAAGTTKIRDPQLEVLTDLVSADVPDLDPTVISARDVISIRTSDEIFERWRVELGNVAKKLAHLEETVVDREDARRKAIREELLGAAIALRSQLKRRKSLPGRILKRLSLGAILRAPFLPIDPLTTGSDIAVDAGQAMVELLETYADASPQIAEAHYHHYLVFGRYIRGLESDRQLLTSKD